MSETNESVDRESSDEINDGTEGYYKDKDFNIEDYQDEIDSEDSYEFDDENQAQKVKFGGIRYNLLVIFNSKQVMSLAEIIFIHKIYYLKS